MAKKYAKNWSIPKSNNLHKAPTVSKPPRPPVKNTNKVVKQPMPVVVPSTSLQKTNKRKSKEDLKKRHKNCEIFICASSTGKLKSKETEMMNELKILFERVPSTDDYNRIGVNSSNAYALILKNYKDNKIVIKIPRKTDGTVDSLKYEYIVGCHIRRTLCKELPNFMKVYGYIYHKDSNEYLILQRIFPGTSLREIICFGPSVSVNDPFIKSLVLQVLCALQIAQNRIKFTHYDLHLGNIVVKEDERYKEKGSRISYTYKDRNKKDHIVHVPVINGQISVIIDYGRTHTDYGGTFLRNNKELFKPYVFLKNKHDTDIRNFDRMYDVKRFVSILKKYIPDSAFIDTNVHEPHDIIKQLV